MKVGPESRHGDRGPDHFNRINAHPLKRYYVKRLEALGFDVTLRPQHGAG